MEKDTDIEKPISQEEIEEQRKILEKIIQQNKISDKTQNFFRKNKRN